MKKFIKNDSGKFWSWTMRMWVEHATEVPFLPDIELQMAKRSDQTAKIIVVEL